MLGVIADVGFFEEVLMQNSFLGESLRRGMVRALRMKVGEVGLRMWE